MYVSKRFLEVGRRWLNGIDLGLDMTIWPSWRGNVS